MMWYWFVPVLLLITSHFAVSEVSNKISDPCSEDIDVKCDQIEYREYVKCMNQRKKRQACPFTQQTVAPILQPNPYQQVIQSAPYQQTCTGGNCYTGNQLAPPCQQQYTTCLNSCQTNECRVNCPYNCQEASQNLQSGAVIYIQKTDGFENDKNLGSSKTSIDERTGSISHQQSVANVGHNITTVIKLTNIVNNTNIVNVPTKINSTNINNINLVTNSSNSRGEYGLGSSAQGSCCIAVEPRKCSGPFRCGHRRHRTCGPQCTSRVIHTQSRQRCHSEGSCAQRIVYVPQPRPQCTYQSSWPYVSCGAGAQQATCNGCYDHYGYGFQNFHGGNFDQQQERCFGCYDDGFNQGSLYRKGPVHRPGYYHQPPQLYYPFQPIPMIYPQMMNPFMYQQQQLPRIPRPPYQDCGYGCFGNELIDPAFGNSPYDNRRYNSFDYSEDFDDYDGLSREPVVPTWNNVAADVENNTNGVPKCKVKSADGKISNCTPDVISLNPYAQSFTKQNLNVAESRQEVVQEPPPQSPQYHPLSRPYFGNEMQNQISPMGPGETHVGQNHLMRQYYGNINPNQIPMPGQEFLDNNIGYNRPGRLRRHLFGRSMNNRF